MKQLTLNEVDAVSGGFAVPGVVLSIGLGIGVTLGQGHIMAGANYLYSALNPTGFIVIGAVVLGASLSSDVLNYSEVNGLV